MLFEGKRVTDFVESLLFSDKSLTPREVYILVLYKTVLLYRLFFHDDIIVANHYSTKIDRIEKKLYHLRVSQVSVRKVVDAAVAYTLLHENPEIIGEKIKEIDFAIDNRRKKGKTGGKPCLSL